MMRATRRRTRGPLRGFSLIELMISLTILTIVVAAVSTLMIRAMLSRYATGGRFESLQSARTAMDMIASDLRSAGYGTDARDPTDVEPAIAYVDSLQLLVYENLQPYPDDPANAGSPRGYDPASSPNPFAVTGNAWTPGRQYGTGAELVQWTLDANDDGAVDAGDVADPEGADARRSRNPFDYVLLRRVFGEVTGTSPGDNGGATERIALVNKPGDTTKPLFNVYTSNATTPWNWSLGPLPAESLAAITRVDVNVTAWSSRPDPRGRYGTTVLSTSVNSFRNTPDFGAPTFLVDGYVFDDADLSGALDGSETGISGVAVRLGAGRFAYTSATGYFAFHVPAGTYGLRHTPASGYGAFNPPDTTTITVGPATSFSFADTAHQGGTLQITVWNDADGNGTQGGGEAGLAGVTVDAEPGGNIATTNASGIATMTLSPGDFLVTVPPPAGYVATTTNPISVTISNGANTNIKAGMKVGATGTVAARVFKDTNKNGILDGAEVGYSGATVVVTDATGNSMGAGVSNASGNVSITVAYNQPPSTNPYSVSLISPVGYWATTPQSYGPLWVTSGSTSSTYNFGLSTWTTQTISFASASCWFLASGDLAEGDNSGWPPTRYDIDLVIGIDNVSSQQVRAYRNTWSGSGNPMGTSSYSTITLPAAILSLKAVVADTFDVKNATTAMGIDAVFGFPKAAPVAANENFGIVTNTGTNQKFNATPTYYLTTDQGTVQALASIDLYGNARPDLVVGTSTSSGVGTFEVWENTSTSGAVGFTMRETFSTPGGGFWGSIGEVTAMALGDVNKDGRRDLVVGEKTGTYNGELLVFINQGKGVTPVFVCKSRTSLIGDAVTSLAIADVDGDTYPDVIVGSQSGTYAGNLLVYRNMSSSSPGSLALRQTRAAPGLVLSLAAADYGGTTTITDLLAGYQTNSSYAGGLAFYSLENGYLPSAASDPTSGSVTGAVVGISAANFNYAKIAGTDTPGPPYLTDFALAVRTAASAAKLFVFFR